MVDLAGIKRFSRKSPEAYEREARVEGTCLLAAVETGNLVRMLYQERHGVKLPRRIHVLHTCDRPSCINDAHHFLGTHSDNMRDAVRKGRHTAQNLSAQAKENIRAANRKRKISPETRSKMLEGIARYWAQRKGTL